MNTEVIETPRVRAENLSQYPGMTACFDCRVIIETPNNVIPGQWAKEHFGHTVAMNANGIVVFGVNETA
jgi:disulfide bond formation protein DsbB